MKWTCVVSCLLTYAMCLQAQPEITRETLMDAGDTYAVAEVMAVPSPGSSGAGAMWDFSNINAGTPVTFQVVLPAATPYAGVFTESNLAFVAPGQIFQFQRLTDEIYEEHGYVVPGFSGYTLAYSDPRVLLQLPFTYQNQWSDAYTYTISYIVEPSILTYGEGAIDVVVDAYGTVRLPQGTFDDVVRVLVTGNSTDTTDLGAGLYERNYYTETMYLWYSASYHAPICMHSSGSLVRYTTVIQGGDTTVHEMQNSFTSFTIDPTAEPGPSSVRHVTPGKFDLSAAPNPCVDGLEISFKAETAGNLSLKIFDMYGIPVKSATWRVTEGVHTYGLQCGELVPGIYNVILTSGKDADMVRLVRMTR